jgi:ATP-dependent DNA ligase
MLHRRPAVDVTPFVFDVLAVDGLATTMNPYAERRALLEAWDSTLRRWKRALAGLPVSGACRARTGDPQLAKLVLSQLS